MKLFRRQNETILCLSKKKYQWQNVYSFNSVYNKLVPGETDKVELYDFHRVVCNFNVSKISPLRLRRKVSWFTGEIFATIPQRKKSGVRGQNGLGCLVQSKYQTRRSCTKELKFNDDLTFGSFVTKSADTRDTT